MTAWGQRDNLSFALGSSPHTTPHHNLYRDDGSVDVQGDLTPATIVSVVDGDTVRVRLNRREERVRLIGIDTPEIDEPFGPAASDYAEQLVSAGDTVLVELDDETRDYYDRLLGYLYVPSESGEWHYEGETYAQLNQEIVRAGFANTLSITPNVRYKDVYQQAVFRAAQNRRGMWE